MSFSVTRMSGAGARIVVSHVDASPLFRAGVAEALRTCPRIDLVGEGQAAADAVELARKRALDVLLLDIKVPGDGMQALSTIAHTWPAVKLVVLSDSECEEDVSRAMRLGSRGYVLKTVSAVELTTAVQSIARGEVYITPSLGARLLSRPAQPVRPDISAPRLDDLTQREVQILSQVSIGATNKEIARTLKISEKTVKYYMTSIMQKLQVRNRVEAVVLMRRHTGGGG